MTPRKPPGMSFPDWVERQIRDAQAQGAFDNLPGAGKPIRGLDRHTDELSWVADYLRRENVDVAALLPPALALAKEVEQLPERLARERSASTARGIVEDLNARIREAHRLPQTGPPIRVRPVNVDDVLDEWTQVRAALDQAALEQITLAERKRAELTAAVARPRRRPAPWWRRRRRRR